MEKEERAAYQKAYYEKNKATLLEKQRERGKRNYRANPEKYRVRSMRWKTANLERYRELQRANAQKNRAKLRAKQREWYQRNKDRASKQSRKQRLAMYGLTPHQYAQMLSDQNGRCAICGSTKAFNSRKEASLHVDHCHDTGMVRGLLCRRCNSGLGHFRDNLELLTRAIDYLSRSSSGATSMTNNAQ